MKVFLGALGCKLNESELEAWARQFTEQGDLIVEDASKADLCVVNSCTVTRIAAKKSRGVVNKIARGNKNARILLTGCYATISPHEAQTLPNVGVVVPNNEKDRLVALASKFMRDSAFQISENGCRMPEAASGELGSDTYINKEIDPTGTFAGQNTTKELGGRAIPNTRTRAFVKIEDGCNMSCTYCIIPLARGRARSRPQKEIVDEITHLVDNGYKEVILTGVQISDYRLEEREAGRGRLSGLCSLVREILSRTHLERLRLTSIAPWDMDEEFLELFSDRRICRHLHLSLQSGCSTVLRRMRRPYSAEQFEEVVARVRQKLPEVGITTDVIVGFPGESDVEFESSRDFVERINFARVHVFPYSARAGTFASRLPLHVDEKVKDVRSREMQRVADYSSSRFASGFVGRTLPVLYESRDEVPERWSGYSDNYIRVSAGGDNLGNLILPTHIQGLGERGALGAITPISS